MPPPPRVSFYSLLVTLFTAAAVKMPFALTIAVATFVLSVVSFGVFAEDDGSHRTCPANTAAGLSAPGSDMSSGENWKDACSIYDFVAEDITGTNVSLRKYAGHVVMIVNVASRCGFTDTNYRQLQELHDKYASHDPPLSILAFPCNQFGSQEPGSNAEIADFCKSTYNVNFDMFGKVAVNGDNAHPLWKFLKLRQGGTLGDSIKWNFTKFLVNKAGQPVGRYSPTTEPNAIEQDIKKLLAGASHL